MLLLTLVLSAPTLGAQKKKKAAPPPPPPVTGPVAAPAPPPPPPAEPAAAAPVPDPPVAAPAAPAAPALAAEELVPLPPLRPKTRFVLSASGGVVAPFSVLGAGGRGELRLTWLTAAPLAFSLSTGFEQHAARTAATFLPSAAAPLRGFDPAALDNQTLFPVQVLVHGLLLRDEASRLDVAAGYAVLLAWTSTHALGTVADESGVGHEVAAEVGYARRLGPVELSLRARWSVRRTAVGPVTATLELPWYQAAGALLGLGLPL